MMKMTYMDINKTDQEVFDKVESDRHKIKILTRNFVLFGAYNETVKFTVYLVEQTGNTEGKRATEHQRYSI